jgi:uncharacterized protein (TIGR02285 family)
MKGLALALLVTAGAATAEEAVWMIPAVPPAVVAEGPLAGQGGSELALRSLGQALPQFAWRYEFATPLREMHEIAQRGGVCSFGFAKRPEREQIMLFNNRPMVSPGYGLIIRDDRSPEFQRFLDAGGALDLDRLAEDKALHGGYSAGRNLYGSMKDFIENNPSRLTVDGDSGRLFRQLKARRLDYLFGSRDEVLYYASSLGNNATFTAFPLVGMSAYGKGYIACSKGPVGEKVIAAVDAYLDDDAHWATFIAPWERWLTPADFAAAVKSPVIKPNP